jgi:hypothetical protein
MVLILQEPPHGAGDMRKLKTPLHLILAVLATATMAAQAPETQPKTSTAATEYLNHVVDLMQQNALHAKEIDWAATRAEAMKRADGAQTTVDTYPAIYFALTQLKEHHSFLRLPDNLSDADKKRTYAALNQILVPYFNQAPKRPDSPFKNRTEPSGHLLRAGDLAFAYISIPVCGAKHSNWQDNTEDFQKYADSLHKIASDLESSNPRGWIIDLRGNGGGNMWPMIAGIGFVLGEGRLGSFVAPDGGTVDWGYHDGKAVIGPAGAETLNIAVKDPPLALPTLPPVAVLIDSGTASSGEAVAISFAGRPQERSFGTHTFGLSTSNNMFPLSDGASLFLNTAVEEDRLNRRYEEGIAPDVAVAEPASAPTEADDAAIHAAEEWLTSLKLQ